MAERTEHNTAEASLGLLVSNQIRRDPATMSENTILICPVECNKNRHRGANNLTENKGRYGVEMRDGSRGHIRVVSHIMNVKKVVRLRRAKKQPGAKEK